MVEKRNNEFCNVYEKPMFAKEKGLAFPSQIIEQFNNGRLCVQCSSCHGCK